MNNYFYVYNLRDPRKDNEPFYTGKGQRKRSQQHTTVDGMKRCGNKLKNSIINKIRSEGLEPVIEIVESNLSEDDAFALERKLIAQYGRRDLGLGPLANLTDGGEGMSGHIFTVERRQNISRSLTGKKLSAAHRQALSEGAKRRVRAPMSEETKERIRVKATGRGHSEKTKKKISEIQKGTTRGPLSEETRAKIGAAQRGKPRLYLIGHKVSEKTRRKISEALTGNIYGPLSDDHRRKVSEALKGRVFTDQARENMRQAQLNRHKKEHQNEVA